MHDSEREGPGQPEQPEEGFDEGQRDGSDDEKVGRFDEGQETLPEDGTPKRRFSEGQEGALTPEETAEGDFATGEHDGEK